VGSKHGAILALFLSMPTFFCVQAPLPIVTKYLVFFANFDDSHEKWHAYLFFRRPATAKIDTSWREKQVLPTASTYKKLNFLPSCAARHHVIISCSFQNKNLYNLSIPEPNFYFKQQ